MSGAADSKAPHNDASNPKDQQNPSTAAGSLEEDDEFEDFPIDDWPITENEVPGASSENANATTHLWEESWDDDDTSEDFSQQLKQELDKVKSQKS